LLSAGLVFIHLLFNYTRFGYTWKAFQPAGQKTAVDTGVNEKLNALISYALSGMFMGIVGLIRVSTQGSVLINLSFESVSIMMSGFFPVFIGVFISRFCDESIGLFLGAITYAFIILGFVRMDVVDRMQNLANGFFLLAFLIWLNNEYKIKQKLGFKKRIQRESN
jgi:ribose/xylose/arabinose/galactoside ABC-type transport system permease subunit